MQTYAETRFAADVVVAGGGWSALTAALAARAAGRSVILAAPGATVAAELTLALDGAFSSVTDPHFQAVVDRIASLGGRFDGWLDPPIGELVVDRLLAEAGVHLLLYTVPVAVTQRDGQATGLLVGGKDGFQHLAGGAVVDATADLALTAAAGGAVAAAGGVLTRRNVFFQLSGDDLTGWPAAVAGYGVTWRSTWPGETVVSLTGDGSLQQFRAAVAQVGKTLRAAVPGLAEAVVSHTSHAPLALGGRVVAAAPVTGLFAAGGAGWGDPDRLAVLGTAAGTAAAAAAVAPMASREPVPAAEVRETDVLVAGGGTGGALAAIAAGRLGARTTLVEAGWFMGGIGTGGGIHMYYHGIQGGIQDEVDAQVRAVTDDLGGPAKVLAFHPEAKKIVLESLAAQAGVETEYGWTVVDVSRDGDRVTGVVAVSPGRVVRWQAKALADCTGDGDLVARAGGPFIRGREKDGVNHAFSQSCGLMRDGKVAFTNFDAGHLDATDVTELTRARRHGIQLYWPAEPFTEANRMLYLAPLLGLRQSRHIVGDYQLSLADQVAGRTFDDVVAYGACHYDNHAFDYENESDEGMFWAWVLGQWHRQMRHGVPYRALLPHGVEGLVVGSRALSVSHDAHQLFRMQRDMQRIGEAAGTAAALAAQDGVTPRQVPIGQLQDALRQTGALLDDWVAGDALPPVGELIGQLAEPEPQLAVWQLYQHGAAAVPALLATLAGGPSDARWYAATVLAMLGHHEAQPVLLEALVSHDEQWPYNAHFKSDHAPWLSKYSAPRWLAAIPLLARIGDGQVVAALAQVLAGPLDQPDAVIAAIRALGAIGDPAAVAVLDQLLARPDLPGSAALQDSMAGAGRSKAVRDAVWQIRLAATEAYERLGHPHPELAEPYLDDERGFVRNYAHEVIGEPTQGRATGPSAGARVSATVRRG